VTVSGGSGVSGLMQQGMLSSQVVVVVVVKVSCVQMMWWRSVIRVVRVSK
jgi:hypothetical protein